MSDTRPSDEFAPASSGAGAMRFGATAQALDIDVDGSTRVSALWQRPPGARAACVLAHGAGAGMTHAFMAATANGLAQRGIASLRYQFAYMERGSKRPDAPALAHAAVRAAVATAQALAVDLPLYAGGKSFGGRMTSQAQAAAPLPGVRGLFFIGFPLHPAGRPSDARAKHLGDVGIPMLFLQGTRDELADLSLLHPVVEQLGDRARLELLVHADHAFHVPARSGCTDAQTLADMLDRLARWMMFERA
ncbi:MAG: alpha/beta family hydrolase [Burkholderiaceae bacterium]